jgi:hypothetical protein
VELLVQLEQSELATWVRESESLWAYPIFISLHTIGLAFLVGFSAAIDLRILGVAPRMPLAGMGGLFLIMWFGFWVNALSGVVLLFANPTNFLTNPVFYIKLGFIALAVVTLRLLQTLVFCDPATLDTRPVPTKGRILAGTSLAAWLGAITAGRWTAYIGYDLHRILAR